MLRRKSKPVLAIREKVSLAASTFWYHGLKTTLEPPAEITSKPRRRQPLTVVNESKLLLIRVEAGIPRP